MSGLSRLFGVIIALAGLVLYATTMPRLYQRPRAKTLAEMQVAVPRFVQVIMSGGDRFLAANLAGFRALVASTETMGPENYRIQALVQSDAAWLNPSHEDNYYIAAAILPWNEQVEAAQYILRKATQARPFDWQPPFYYAFNALHFLKNPVEGAEWLRIAGQHTRDELEKLSFQQLAAQWSSKGEDLELAIRLHRAMARETHHKSFAAFLEKRAQRLENLLQLQQAIATFTERTGNPPVKLQQLVDAGVLPFVPVDPFGLRYVIDNDGQPQAEQAGTQHQGQAK